MPLAGTLLAVRKNLKDSTFTKWSAGYLDDWRDHALRMKHAIENSDEILSESAKTAENLEGRIMDLEMQLAKKDELIAEKDRVIVALATR